MMRDRTMALSITAIGASLVAAAIADGSAAAVWIGGAVGLLSMIAGVVFALEAYRSIDDEI